MQSHIYEIKNILYRTCSKIILISGIALFGAVTFVMKEIKLTQNKIAFVNDEDFDYLNQWRWYAKKSGRTYYAGRQVKTGMVKPRQRPVQMHNQIMVHDEGFIDHKDGDGLNNQRDNLRLCSKSENNRNRRPKINGSGYLGVHYGGYKRNGRQYSYWVACIKHNHKRIRLGYFVYNEKGLKAAALTYNEAAKKYHGDFARLNIIT